jgi:hypothetical protein
MAVRRGRRRRRFLPALGGCGGGPRAALAALGALAWAAAGCDPDVGEGRFPDRVLTQPDATVGDADAGGPDGGAVGPLSGAWIQVVEWSTCVKIVDEIETRAYRVLAVQVSQQGARLRERRRLCELRLTPILGMATVVPQPLIDAHPELLVDSMLLSAAPRAPAGELLYHSGPEVQRFGIEFTDPLSEPMPTAAEPDDPRLVDAEQDGKPGATFHVGSQCSIHVAQREISVLRGRVVGPGRIEGGGVHHNEQAVFGSTKAICGQTFSTRSNQAAHRFALQRAEGFDDDGDGALSCAELRAHAAEVLAPLPADDARCLQ